MATYSDFIIGSLDENFLNKLSDKFGIAWEDIKINVEDPSPASITNQIIYGLYYQYISENIENEDLKEELIANIYTNCFDSCIDNLEYIREKYIDNILENDINILENLE